MTFLCCKTVHFKYNDFFNFDFTASAHEFDPFAALVAEIKELKEKRQQEDNVLLSLAAGCIHPIVPNFVFKYTDADIHEDFYKLIKYSCDEICTSKEQSNKSMRLWCTFLEPMLSVPSRPFGSEDNEVPSASRHHGIKSTGASSRGREETLVADAAAISTKQPRPLSNVDETTSTKQVNSGRLSLLHGEILAKEDGFGLPKDHNYTAGVNKVSVSIGIVASAERPANFDAALAIEEGVELIAGVLSIKLS